MFEQALAEATSPNAFCAALGTDAPAARDLVIAAAVIGREFSTRLLEAVAELGEETLLAAIEALESAHLVAAIPGHTEGRFRFVRTLIQRTLLAGLSRLRKQRLHRRVAEAMERIYADSLDAHAADLAHHYCEAGPIVDSAKAGACLVRTGERAPDADAERLPIEIEQPEARRFYAQMLIDRNGPGDRARARRLFEEAVDAYGHLGMPRYRELAERLPQSVKPSVPVVAAPPEPNLFRKDGHYWTLGYRGQVVRLKDSKALRDIACLLASPGSEVHVAELASEANGIHSTAPPAIGNEQLTRAGLAALGAGGEPVLDARARQVHRARVVELGAELEEAERCNDRGRIERARAEMDAIATALASAYGLSGRGRRPGSAVERARVAVAMRIRNALAKIDNEHPALGHHLLRSIKTGTFCSYQPEAQVDWHL